MVEDTEWDIREAAYREMFDFINWLATEYKDEWPEWMKKYPGKGNWRS